MAFPSAPEQEDWDDDVPPPKPAPVTQPLTRLEYLRLLRLGYIRNQNSSAMPLELWKELEILEDEEKQRLAAIEKLRREKEARILAEQEERRRVLREKNEAPEITLEEYWMSQRQHGRTKAAEAWAKQYGQELPVIIEMAESEEEMREALRKLRNVEQAKRQQGLGRRKRG